MKKPLVILVIAALLIGVLVSVITASNNRIAAGLKDRLLRCPLPKRSELLDAASVAGKLTGAGNGMQYRGAILVRTLLTEEELLAYYQPALEEDGLILYIDSLASAEAFADLLFPAAAGQENVYQIMLFRNMPVGTETSFWEALLNCDLRGH